MALFSPEHIDWLNCKWAVHLRPFSGTNISGLPLSPTRDKLTIFFSLAQKAEPQRTGGNTGFGPPHVEHHHLASVSKCCLHLPHTCSGATLHPSRRGQLSSWRTSLHLRPRPVPVWRTARFFGRACSQTGQSETWHPASDWSRGQRQTLSAGMEMFCLEAAGVFLIWWQWRDAREKENQSVMNDRSPSLVLKTTSTLLDNLDFISSEGGFSVFSAHRQLLRHLFNY